MMRVKTVATVSSLRSDHRPVTTYACGVPTTEEPTTTATTGEVLSRHKVLTIPNIISFVRLCCIPVFLWLLFGRHNRGGAAWLLAGLGATDWIDGYIARNFDQTSELGKVLDPTADRLLFIVGIVAIIIDGSAPVWLSVLVVIREVLIAVLLVVLTLMGMKRFPVTWWGKTATFLLMFAFPLFLLSHALNGRWHTFTTALAWLTGLPGLIISYATFVDYVPKMRRALVEGRAERAGAGTAPSGS
jgi:cardiolipin synthase (CMP-forming)